MLLGQFHQHEGAIAGGVETGIGEADAHIFPAENVIPVVCVDLIGVSAVLGVGQGQAVAGEFEIPVTIGNIGVGHGGVVHEHGDEGMVGADHDVDGFVQFGVMAQYLDAAVELGVNIHLGVGFFKGGFDLVQGDDEAARGEDGQRGFFLRGAAGQGGDDEEDEE